MKREASPAGRSVVASSTRSRGALGDTPRAHVRGSLLSERLSERAAFCSARRSGRDGPSRRLTLGALGRPSARAAAPAAAPAAAAVGNSIGLGQPPRTRRRTTSATRRRRGRAIATLVTTFTQTYPNADRFYAAPLPHHRPLYLRARRPRAPRIHRRRQRGDGTQFNAVGPLIRILIEDDDRRRAAADDPHPGAAAAWRRLGALDGPLAPRAAHRIDGVSLGLRGASTSGCVEMASKKVSLGVFSDTDTPTHSPSTWCSSSCECFSSMFALRSLASAARRAAIPPLLSTIREPRACVGSQV